jgi:hypothetical protein
MNKPPWWLDVMEKALQSKVTSVGHMLLPSEELLRLEKNMMGEIDF